MTTIHARLIGRQALLEQSELERLVELARRSEPVDLQLEADDLPTVGIMRLAEQGGLSNFGTKKVKTSTRPWMESRSTSDPYPPHANQTVAGPR
jgi:hypothetical protein